MLTIGDIEPEYNYITNDRVTISTNGSSQHWTYTHHTYPHTLPKKQGPTDSTGYSTWLSTALRLADHTVHSTRHITAHGTVQSTVQSAVHSTAHNTRHRTTHTPNIHHTIGHHTSGHHNQGHHTRGHHTSGHHARGHDTRGGSSSGHHPTSHHTCSINDHSINDQPGILHISGESATHIQDRDQLGVAELLGHTPLTTKTQQQHFRTKSQFGVNAQETVNWQISTSSQTASLLSTTQEVVESQDRGPLTGGPTGPPITEDPGSFGKPPGPSAVVLHPEIFEIVAYACIVCVLGLQVSFRS